MSETVIPFTFTPEATEDSIANLTPLSLHKAHADDAAYDLCAAEDFYLTPGDRALVKTGVRLAIPEGFAGLVLPRSGLAIKHGITVLNAPGLIDPGYRGEVGVILVHFGLGSNDRFHFHGKRGDRIAQLLIVRTADVRLAYFTPRQTETLWHPSKRGEGGFGSTGR